MPPREGALWKPADPEAKSQPGDEQTQGRQPGRDTQYK